MAVQGCLQPPRALLCCSPGLSVLFTRAERSTREMVNAAHSLKNACGVWL